MSIFFNEQPIVLNTKLAKLIGLNESIVLQQIHYWIEINKKAGKNLRNGRFWTYNTFEEWKNSNFDFWSMSTIVRTISRLEKKGFLINGNFNKKGFDRTKWYTIDYDKLENLESLENTHFVKMTKSVNINVSEDNKNNDENLESLENTHFVKMTKSVSQNDKIHFVKMTRPIPENTKEINNRDLQKNQVIVKSSHIEKKEDRENKLSTDRSRELEELKKEKEILKQKKEIEELKQQINNLKQHQEEKKEIKIDDLHKYDFYKDTIKKSIDYDWIFNNFALAEKPNRETSSIDDYKLYKSKQDFIKLLDTFLDIMAEVMASNKKTIKINQEEIGQALVSKKFEMLTQGQIFFAVRQYQEYAQKTEVKYPKSYILTCLYNATTEQVAKDFTL